MARVTAHNVRSMRMLSFPSPRLRGECKPQGCLEWHACGDAPRRADEGRFVEVRARLRHAPHPYPLPASGEREGPAASRARSALAIALVAALLCACAAPQRLDAPASAPRDRSAHTVDREVYADLIRSMLDQGQYYAALAHVQQRRAAGGGDRNELAYLEAEARRGLGQIEAADALYQSLLRSRLAGPAYHGLGLLHAGTEPARAIAFLREASRLRPTDADLRNDLGYALLGSGRYREALHELATAVELAPESAKARNNLLLLMMMQGDEAAVTRIAREAAVPPETVARLRQQARALMKARIAPGGR